MAAAMNCDEGGGGIMEMCADRARRGLLRARWW